MSSDNRIFLSHKKIQKIFFPITQILNLIEVKLEKKTRKKHKFDLFCHLFFSRFNSLDFKSILS